MDESRDLACRISALSMQPFGDRHSVCLMVLRYILVIDAFCLRTIPRYDPMSMFTFKNKVGTAKQILIDHNEIVK